jgi:leucyl-tRNA synthetase
LAKEKSGVFTGAFGVHPVSGQEVPIWIADYVLISYGTGAIMAVPAHDERDYAFAKQFSLPITEVVAPKTGHIVDPNKAFCDYGISINSDFLNGLPTEEAKSRMIDWLEEKKVGARRIQYKLRDWLFSRQRYWGEPFPIVWKTGPDGVSAPEPISESELPLTLPEMDDFKPSPEGKPPLAKATEWLNLPDGSIRETNTMPQWAGSCWYYLRFCDPHNDQAFISPEAEKYWLGTGVDLYIGGAEHAVLHLLYTRFWHKVFFDMGLVSNKEPFHKLVNQGLILGEDHTKMSKSLGNVINPDEIVAEYGADSLRLFEMFMGPLEQTKPWSTKGVEGVYGFLGRVWRLVMEEQQDGSWKLAPVKVTDAPASEALLRRLHGTIEKVTDDIEKLKFNTAIAALMVLVNDLTKEPVRPKAVVETLLLLLSPFAPHMAEELWHRLGHEKTLAYEPWPKAEARYLVQETMEIPVQVNGKLRGVVVVPFEAVQAVVEEAARKSEVVAPFLTGKTVRKLIFVPNKLINFVI